LTASKSSMPGAKAKLRSRKKGRTLQLTSPRGFAAVH
jgi:hypothetical protein